MATKKKKCGCCGEHGHFNRVKTPCPNKARVQKEKEAVKDAKLKARKEAKDVKRKAKEAEQERKRAEDEIKKKLKPPKAGTSVKGRDGSTRNGYIISYSKYHSKPITEADIDNRNTRLGIDPKMCFHCKIRPAKCGDHLFPACNTNHSCYSWSSALCIVPSCLSCNSLKGGKIIEEWVKELPRLGWTPYQIKTLLEWTRETKDKLVLQKSDVEHVEKQFPVINKFHALLDYCCKTKTDICEHVTIYDTTTSVTAELASEIAALKAENAALKAELASK
jgi:hypothetical protein